MIDPTGLASLFYDIFKDWKEHRIAHVDPLSAIEQEPVYQDLKAKAHTFKWPRQTQLRQVAREGWQPVVERDQLGRGTIFVDRNEELILVHRIPEDR